MFLDNYRYFYSATAIFEIKKNMENPEGMKIEPTVVSEEPFISSLDIALFVVIMTVAYFWYFKRDKRSSSSEKKPYTIQ